MRFEGSQYRFAGSIADAINPYIDETRPFVQLYCGRAHIGIRVKAKKKIFLDTDEGMVGLWKQLDAGWIPPLLIDSTTYHFMKNHREGLQPFFAAFVGRAVSIKGKLWGYYDHKRNANPKRNLAVEAFRSLRDDLDYLRSTTDYYDFRVGKLNAFDLDKPYTVYVDMPEDSEIRDDLYDLIKHTKHKWIWFVAEPDRPPITFYKVWQFNSVSPVDNIFLMSSTKELK